MQQIKLVDIDYDPYYYPRVNSKEDWMTVLRYKQALTTHPDKADSRKRGSFPPIAVVRVTGRDYKYLLLDGLHRIKAFHGAGLKSIYAVIEKLPKSKWFARSVELNTDSKRGLDKGDRQHISKRLKADGWKVEKIAALLQMELSSFEKMMSTGIEKLTAAQAKRIPEGRGNRKVNGGYYGFLKAPLQHSSGTNNATAALTLQSTMTARTVTDVLDSFIALLEAKCIDETDEAVVGRMVRIRELLKTRR